MSDKTVKMDGNLTLDQTKSRCIEEQNAGYQISAIQNATISQNGEALLVNKAEFDANLDWLRDLLFVEPDGNDPATIKTNKKADGWTFLCSGAIYVQGNIKNVMVFGK